MFSELATMFNHVVAGNFGDNYHPNSPEPPPPPQKAPPASRRAVNALPLVTVTADDLLEATNKECLICLEEQALGSVACKLQCGHLFHKECVTEWLVKHCTCPVCRFELETDNLDYEVERKTRMKDRKLRYRLDELQGKSVAELRDICRSLVISISDCIDKREIVDRIVNSGKVLIMQGVPTMEIEEADFNGKSVSELKHLLLSFGLETADAIEKSELRARLVESGRVHILRDPSTASFDLSYSPSMDAYDRNIATDSLRMEELKEDTKDGWTEVVVHPSDHVVRELGKSDKRSFSYKVETVSDSSTDELEAENGADGDSQQESVCEDKAREGSFVEDMHEYSGEQDHCHDLQLSSSSENSHNAAPKYQNSKSNNASNEVQKKQRVEDRGSELSDAEQNDISRLPVSTLQQLCRTMGLDTYGFIDKSELVAKVCDAMRGSGAARDEAMHALAQAGGALGKVDGSSCTDDSGSTSSRQPGSEGVRTNNGTGSSGSSSSGGLSKYPVRTTLAAFTGLSARELRAVFTESGLVDRHVGTLDAYSLRTLLVNHGKVLLVDEIDARKHERPIEGNVREEDDNLIGNEAASHARNESTERSENPNDRCEDPHSWGSATVAQQAHNPRNGGTQPTPPACSSPGAQAHISSSSSSSSSSFSTFSGSDSRDHSHPPHDRSDANHPNHRTNQSSGEGGRSHSSYSTGGSYSGAGFDLNFKFNATTHASMHAAPHHPQSQAQSQSRRTPTAPTSAPTAAAGSQRESDRGHEPSTRSPISSSAESSTRLVLSRSLLQEMSVREIKSIAQSYHVSLQGCLEKTDMFERLERCPELSVINE